MQGADGVLVCACWGTCVGVRGGEEGHVFSHLINIRMPAKLA